MNVPKKKKHTKIQSTQKCINIREDEYTQVHMNIRQFIDQITQMHMNIHTCKYTRAHEYMPLHTPKHTGAHEYTCT